MVEVVGRGQKGWLKWLQSLDRPCLELLFREVAKKNANGPELIEYTEIVRKSMSLGVCSKCEWKTGCESCNYEHALRYAVRHEKPASWFFKAQGKARRMRYR